MKKRLREWGRFVLVLSVLYVVAGPTQLGGPLNYVIVDGRSMEPTYDDGDLVIARQQDRYEVGDVITYDAPVEGQFRVIHRITEVVDGGYRTQGDNRDEPDGWTAPDDAIHGITWLHLPHGGDVVALLRQPSVLLALVAGWITFLVLERREKRDRQVVFVDRPSGDPTRQDEGPTLRSSEAPSTRKEVAHGVALLVLAALVGGTAAIGVAHAATLTVDGSTLQSFSTRTEVKVQVISSAAATELGGLQPGRA